MNYNEAYRNVLGEAKKQVLLDMYLKTDVYHKASVDIYIDKTVVYLYW